MGIPINGLWNVFLSQIVKHKHPNFEEWSSAQCWRWYCSRLQISDGFKLWVWAFESSIIKRSSWFIYIFNFHALLLRFILIFASPISDSTSTRSVTIVANILRVERTGFHKISLLSLLQMFLVQHWALEVAWMLPTLKKVCSIY